MKYSGGEKAASKRWHASAAGRAAAKRFREKLTPAKRFAYKIKTLYGLTMEQYENLRTLANGICAICHRAESLVIDHDHTTKRVRGMLCDSCNKALGFLRDDPDTAAAAAAYLENSRTG
jgi:hypothetical protein